MRAEWLPQYSQKPMLSGDSAFRTLGLCASPLGSASVSERLRRDTIDVKSWERLAQHAEDHGLEPLFRAHLLEADIPLPAAVADRLRIRWMQHAHASAVRTRVLTGVLKALEDDGIPALLLKGAALAHLVYENPILRPMRDVDVLVRARDASRATCVLEACGFAAAGPVLPPGHHHMRAMSTTVDSATVTVELHRQLLQPTPFLRPVDFDDVYRNAQTFDWSDQKVRGLGREDMLWHVYAHAFATNVTRPAIRLISVADLVTLAEAWVEDIDWEQVRRRYRTVWDGLPFLHHLTPWSPRVQEKLRCDVRRRPNGLRPIAPHLSWIPCRDVMWPTEWWMGVRYGTRGRSHRLWCRMIAHPVRLVAAAVRWIGRVRTQSARLSEVHAAQPQDHATN